MNSKTLLFVLALFILETVFQIFYLTIETRLFDSLKSMDSFSELFFENIHFFGSVKAIFCLPLYLLVHFFISKHSSRLKTAFIHTSSFVLCYLFSLPFAWAMGRGLVDFIFLTIISFLSSYLMSFSKNKG